MDHRADAAILDALELVVSDFICGMTVGRLGAIAAGAAGSRRDQRETGGGHPGDISVTFQITIETMDDLRRGPRTRRLAQAE